MQNDSSTLPDNKDQQQESDSQNQNIPSNHQQIPDGSFSPQQVENADAGNPSSGAQGKLGADAEKLKPEADPEGTQE